MVYRGKHRQTSEGSAEVVYSRRSDAFAAVKKYHNVMLDGKPMKLEIVSAASEVPISARVNVSGVNGRRKRTVVMIAGQGWGRGVAPSERGSGVGRRGGMRNGGRGQKAGKKQPVDKSAEDLDKELDMYHADAMQSELQILLCPGWCSTAQHVPFCFHVFTLSVTVNDNVGFWMCFAFVI